jgi:hypothetical protein
MEPYREHIDIKSQNVMPGMLVLNLHGGCCMSCSCSNISEDIHSHTCMPPQKHTNDVKDDLGLTRYTHCGAGLNNMCMYLSLARTNPAF